jgi:chromosome segregation ATPase
MRYKYFEDLNNNQYRWTLDRDSNNYYLGVVYKYKSQNNWGRWTSTKSRLFRKKKDAKAWCLKLVRRARGRQEVVLTDRAIRKEEREALKPILTKAQIKLAKFQKDIERLNANIKRADSKLKGLTTRKTTYEKKIKKNYKEIRKLEALL